MPERYRCFLITDDVDTSADHLIGKMPDGVSFEILGWHKKTLGGNEYDIIFTTSRALTDAEIETAGFVRD